MGLDRAEADVLCDTVAEKLDPEEIVDVLGMTSEELVEELRSWIIEYADRFDEWMEDSDEDVPSRG